MTPPHLYGPTRASFCKLFPRLREGGFYIIEDWGWARWPGDFWQGKRGGSYFSAEPPLSNLLFEIAALTASAHDLVREVIIHGVNAYVRRGSLPATAPLDLNALISNRGDPMLPISQAG